MPCIFHPALIVAAPHSLLRSTLAFSSLFALFVSSQSSFRTRATVYPRTFPSPCFFVSTEDDRVEKKGRVSPRNQITPASTNSGASPAKPASGKFLFGVGLATAAGAVGVGDVGGAVAFEEPEAAELGLIEAMGESNISVCGHQRYSIGHLVLKSNKHSQEKRTPFPASNADDVPAFSTCDLRVSPKKQAHALSTLGVGKTET